jgi:hypothetical protein
MWKWRHTSSPGLCNERGSADALSARAAATASRSPTAVLRSRLDTLGLEHGAGRPPP